MGGDIRELLQVGIRSDQLLVQIAQLTLRSLNLLQQQRLVDGLACMGCQSDDDFLVKLGELVRALLLRQVNPTKDPLTGSDGDAQEGPHRRMLRWESDGCGVLSEVLEPKHVFLTR